MEGYVYFNDAFVEESKAVLPIRTHAFLYGTSVFEGIRAYFNNEDNQLYIFRAKEHFERILRSAKIMHMECQYSVDEMVKLTKELLKKNAYKQDAYIRPTLYKSKETIEEIKNSDKSVIFMDFSAIMPRLKQ